MWAITDARRSVSNQHQTLLDQVRDALRLKHYSIRTEANLRGLDHALHPVSGNKRHPKDMGSAEVASVPDPPGRGKNVAASTPEPGPQRLALSVPRGARPRLEFALVDTLRAKKPKRLPTVLTRDESLRVIGGM